MKFQVKLSKSSQNLHVLGDIDFRRILGGFGEGFERPKPSIFAVFSIKTGSKNEDVFWKAKKSSFEASRGLEALFLELFSGLCGPGGKEKGWGEGNLAGNLA